MYLKVVELVSVIGHWTNFSSSKYCDIHPGRVRLIKCLEIVFQKRSEYVICWHTVLIQIVVPVSEVVSTIINFVTKTFVTRTV